MIEEFEAWFREHEPQFKDSFVQVEITNRDHPSRTIGAFLESELYIASFALWEIGALDIHVLSISKGDAVFVERYDLENVTEMITILEDTSCKLLHHSFDSV
jgi:hypothetical protein